MKTRYIIAALTATFVLFFCEFTWHMLLPFHANALLEFNQQEKVEAVMKENAPKSGMYFIPIFHAEMQGKTGDELKAIQEKGMKAMEAGPVAFIAYRAEGSRSFAAGLTMQFLSNFLAMLLMTTVVTNCPCKQWHKKILLVMTLVLFGFVVFSVPNWIWWGISEDFVGVLIVSVLINWFIAGSVMIKIAGNPAEE